MERKELIANSAKLFSTRNLCIVIGLTIVFVIGNVWVLRGALIEQATQPERYPNQYRSLIYSQYSGMLNALLLPLLFWNGWLAARNRVRLSRIVMVVWFLLLLVSFAMVWHNWKLLHP